MDYYVKCSIETNKSTLWLVIANYPYANNRRNKIFENRIQLIKEHSINLNVIELKKY
jgi:hypothetical protein